MSNHWKNWILYKSLNQSTEIKVLGNVMFTKVENLLLSAYLVCKITVTDRKCIEI